MISTTCSEFNAPIIKKLLEGGYISICPYTVGFVDACLLASDYELLINYFGMDLCKEVLKYLEEQEYYEECILLKECMDNFDDLEYMF